MKFWLTDGVFHREKTMKKDLYAKDYQLYEDTGTVIDIPDNAERVIIPEGTRCIGYRAFYALDKRYRTAYWSELREVILPEGVEEIEQETFNGCEALERINFPTSLKKLGNSALSNTGLTSLALPETLEEVDDFCFSNCKRLETLTFPVKPIQIGNSFIGAPNLFIHCSSLKRINIPAYCKCDFLYLGCASLEEASLSKGMKKVQNLAFSGCIALRKIDIPDTVMEILPDAFRNCASLKELVIPPKVKKVGKNAFRGCIGLEHIVFKSAFQGYETAFPDSSNVKRIDITNSQADRARTVFPQAAIYSLNGKLIHAASEQIAVNLEEEQTEKDIVRPTKAEFHPGTNIAKLAKTDYCIAAGKHSFQVSFKGAIAANKEIKAYIAVAKGQSDAGLYDPKALMQANAYVLYTIEPHTGVRIRTLEEGYESRGDKRIYSDPMTDEEILKRCTRFVNDAMTCLTEKGVRKIMDAVPKKKNGTLHKGRVTTILKCNIANSEGEVLFLYAKNQSDTELDIAVKKLYIGDDAYSDNEAASYMGII